jgi:amino acid adenylation domain-containing protein
MSHLGAATGADVATRSGRGVAPTSGHIPFLLPASDSNARPKLRVGRSIAAPGPRRTSPIRSAPVDVGESFVAFLAAWSILLSRYSGRGDVRFRVVRELVDARDPETYPLRVQIGSQSVSALLATLRGTIDESGGRASNADPANAPPSPDDASFDSVVILRHGRGDAEAGEPSAWDDAWTRHTLEGELVGRGTILALVVHPSSTGSVIVHDTERITAEDADRTAGHLELSLRTLQADAEQSVSHVPILTAAERHRVLYEWNAPTPHGPSSSWVQDFERTARRRARALAVDGGGEQLTYGGLLRRAHDLAVRLSERGIGAGDVVALAPTRSAEAIVALVGILRAGAAYLALSEDDPPERLARILEDCHASAVVTPRHPIRPLPSLEERRLVPIDSGEPSTDLRSWSQGGTASMEDLAYVTFTSGTTGRPKGVMTTSANLSHYVREAMAFYGIDEHDRVLGLASFSVDFSVAEIFPTLLAGGALVPRDRRFRSTSAEFWSACEQERISVLMLPCPLWAEVAGDILDGTRTLPDSVRLISVGGERAEPDLVRAWLERVPDVTLVNGYGPTETTVEAVCCRLSIQELEGGPGWRAEVPIGRPIPGARAYVIDRTSATLEPTPVGVPGELVIGGLGVARGYIGEDGIAADRFVPDPLADPSDPHDSLPARAYRTGDLARFLPDGSLELLGRIDRGLKIRGHRVEPAEIEGALARHPAISAAVVWDTDGDDAGGHRLLACVVKRPQLEISASELRAFVGGVLPGYMVPAAIRVVEEMPLLPSGEIDREALDRDDDLGEAGAVTTSPADLTALEAGLAAIWSSTLGLDQVGGDEDFFELGGHSLLAMRLASRLRKELGIDVSLEVLFEHPSVRSFAGWLDAAGLSGERSG